MIVDTDVFIWYLRGNFRAQKLIEGNSIQISSVTYMELVKRMRNKTELNQWRKFIKAQNIRILQINEEISAKAMYLIEEFSLSHSLYLADALIGATTLAYGEKLVTGNAKHYKFLPHIDLQVFKAS